MLSYQTVEPHTLELLKKLMAEPSLKDTRLVGGTSLALQYGHRNSVDLDFFGTLDEDPLSIRDCLERIGHVSVLKETKTIRIYETHIGIASPEPKIASYKEFTQNIIPYIAAQYT